MNCSKRLASTITLFLSSVALAVLTSSCKHTPPKHELCVIGEGVVLCTDPRLEPEDYEKTFEESVNMLCTNPQDYQRLQEWYVDKLAECER